MKKYFSIGFVFAIFVFCSFFIINKVNALSDNITQINFTSLPQTIDMNVPSGVITTQTQNISNLSESVSETTTLNYNSTSATGQFSDASITTGICNESTWNSALTLTLASTRANKGFCYKDSTAGTYTLTVTAQGKSWTPATQTITIKTSTIADTTPPTLYLPTDITAEATSSSGAIVNYTATADDMNPIHPVVICNPLSGLNFPLGKNTVNCSATDTAGNVAAGSFNINVVDTTPPIITLLGSDSVIIEKGSTYADEGATALDNYDGDITGNIVTNNPVDTTIVGTYVITYNIVDVNHNSAEQKIRTVKVNDISPVPDIISSISETYGGHRIVSLPIQNNIQTITAGEVLGIEKFKFNTDLYFGMRSDEVKELQKRLISEGLLKPGTLGGYFGIFTKTAVMAYQKENIPLKIDGIVGPLTRQVLNNTQSGA